MGRFINDLKMMTNSWPEFIPEKINYQYFSILWRFLVPIFNTFLLGQLLLKMDSPKREFWGKKFAISNYGWIAVPLLIIPIMIVISHGIKAIRKFGIRESLQPTNNWGPAKDIDRMSYNNLRDDSVVYRTLQALQENETKETQLSREAEALSTPILPV